MSNKENFICLSYGSIDYLIPKSDVYTAFICDASNLVTDSDGKNRIIFLSQQIPCYNLDELITGENQDTSKFKTCIVIPSGQFKKDFKNEYFGLITTSECKVLSESLDIFSVFSDFYGSKLKQKGIVACVLNKDNSRDSKIGYLVDISIFMKKMLEYVK